MNQTGEKGKYEVTIDLMRANKFGVVLMIGTFVVLGGLYALIWQEKIVEDIRSVRFGMGMALYMLLMIVSLGIHELIHGATWASQVKGGWKTISFGVIWKGLALYCHCTEPMNVAKYRIGALMPLIVQGIIPSIVALAIGSLPTLFYGIIFISSAVGDIWVVHLINSINPKFLVLDHPTKAGFYVINPEEQE